MHQHPEPLNFKFKLKLQILIPEYLSHISLLLHWQKNQEEKTISHLDIKIKLQQFLNRCNLSPYVHVYIDVVFKAALLYFSPFSIHSFKT